MIAQVLNLKLNFQIKLPKMIMKKARAVKALAIPLMMKRKMTIIKRIRMMRIM